MYLFLKLVTSSDSMPIVWSILTHKQRESEVSSICRTSLYKSKFFSTKICTVPIKFETELQEKYKKETGFYTFKTKIIFYLKLSYFITKLHKLFFKCTVLSLCIYFFIFWILSLLKPFLLSYNFYLLQIYFQILASTK